MKVLVLGLFVEGPTDNDFLQPVIRRTAEQILAQHEQSGIYEASVLIIQLTKDQKKDRAESILQAACDAYGYYALIVHADADDPEPGKAKVERIEPGFKLVQETNENVCKDLVAIIPVQAIEAWILADYELLLREVGADLKAAKLGIPETAKYVQKISKPKRRLEEAVQIAYASRSRRRRESDIRFLYQPMGEKINLERLQQVPSYKQFVEDLTETLINLNLIPRVH
jgi:ribosomal protein L20